MVHALQSELFRLRRRPQSWIMLVLTGLSIGVFYSAAYVVYLLDEMSATEAADIMDTHAVMSMGMQMFGFLGLILIVILASGLIGAEYGWNTLRPLVAKARTRSALLSAKWITVLLYTALMLATAVIASITFSILGSLLLEADPGFSSELLLYLLEGTSRRFIAVLPYPVIAFAVALLTRSNAAGIAIGISLRLLEPLIYELLGLVSSALRDLQQWGITWNVQQLVVMDNEGVTAGDLWKSSLILGIYCATAIIATYVVFNRRDITSG